MFLLGLALVSSVQRQYPMCAISGTCRSLDKAKNLEKFGIRAYIFNPDVRDVWLSFLYNMALIF